MVQPLFQNLDNFSDIDEVLLDDLNTPGFIAKIHELYNAAIKGDKEKNKIQSSL